MTWLSGMVLLVLVYYSSSGLIDPDIADISQARGIAIGLAVLAGGWIVYDLALRSPLGRSEAAFAAFSLLTIAALAWAIDPRIQRSRCLHSRRSGLRNNYDRQRLVSDSSVAAQNDRGGSGRRDVRRLTRRSSQVAIQTQYFPGGSGCFYHDQQSLSRRDLREQVRVGSSGCSRSSRLGGGESYTGVVSDSGRDLVAKSESSADNSDYNSRGRSHRSMPEACVFLGRRRQHASNVFVAAHA